MFRLLNESECGAFLFDEFLSDVEVDRINRALSSLGPWRQLGARKVFYIGLQPYSYGGITHGATLASDWNEIFREILVKTSMFLGENFNSMLLNYYESGRMHMPFHSDDEVCLGETPTIASISLGQGRFFELRHKFNSELVNVFLPHGSLLVMCGRTQSYYRHAILPDESLEPRLNLTLREILVEY